MNDVRRAEESPVEVPADELEEWLASLDGFIAASGARATEQLIAQLVDRARRAGVPVASGIQTPQVNTIPAEREPTFPGDLALERRITSLVRWNAMAMVVRANRQAEGIGGHISTFASAATLYEVGQNHFFRGKEAGLDADQIYFQGHASPGMYARAFLEGRIDEARVANFRQELRDTPGLSSYPHPWLMPDFWEFPTVSMGLGPIMAIYQARFNRYLEDRGLKPKGNGRVWAFVGDGETDEPESLGALTLASRARLDNLIFVVNCNLQRLDGPVRGNGQIIQELEAAFRGAGWHVIKVILGRDWDSLLAKDPGGLIARRWSEVVDGEVQKYSVSDGAYIREHFWGKYPELRKLVDHLTDTQLQKLNLGGHDPVKVYAAYRAAVEHGHGPVVILARTIKGYGLGEHGEGKNVTHQQKKMNEDELREFRARFGIPISDEELASAPLYRPAPESEEAVYIRERRAALGGPVPQRRVHCEPLPPPAPSVFEEFFAGSGEGRKVATTMAFVRLLAKLLKDESIGRYIVPIVPDEARTFGMESLFRQVGIYSHVGQLYEPVDAASLLYYKEARDGQILEEGITEAGSMSSFIAAGTAYATHGIPTIPMFIYYSMFGFQRIGDLVWAAADMRAKGFMLGATAGRTTLAGEGLQHQDGNSHLLAYPVPQLEAYDPAYAYEMAVIIREGIRRMYEKMEDVFYYLTLMNEPYAMPPMPPDVEDGILRGMYLLHAGSDAATRRVQLCGSGSILREAVAARELLSEHFGVDADVWSVTSWKALHRDAADVERWNRLHPGRSRRTPYFTQCLASRGGPVVAASDYVRAVPESVARFSPTSLTTLGTDGFGRSDGRRSLRDFFEVDARNIALAALVALAREDKMEPRAVEQAIRTLDIDPERANPLLR